MSARSWLPLDGAPKDGTRILLLTSDFGAVEGYWDASVTNFYKSQVGWDSYDPENAQGDWVSEWRMHESPGDYRLYCGCTPQRWMPLVASEIDDEFGDEETPDENGWLTVPAEIDVWAAPFDGDPVILGWVNDFHPRSGWWEGAWVFDSAAGAPITIATGSPQPTHYQPLPKPPAAS